MSPTSQQPDQATAGTPRTQAIIDCLQVAINADNREQSIAYREEAARQIEELETELLAAQSRIAALEAKMPSEAQYLKVTSALITMTERCSALEAQAQGLARDLDEARSWIEGHRQTITSRTAARDEALRKLAMAEKERDAAVGRLCDIDEETRDHSDGSPDANKHDALCNRIQALIHEL